MRKFVKRASQKLSKLTSGQVEQLVDSISGENEAMDAVMESLSTGLLVCNLKWQLIMINKAAERYIPFKTRPHDFRSMENTSTECLWNLISEKTIADFLKEVSDGEKSYYSKEFSISTTSHTRSQRVVSLRITPLVQKKVMNGYIINVDDITEKREQETLMRRMENLASLTNLAASVAHEIKNPLGAISIHIQLMQKAISKARNGDGVLPPQKYVENYLEVINSEIDRLNQIVVDFLFAVRPVQANLELFDVQELIKKFSDFILRELAEKKICLELDLIEKAPQILLDEKLFKQVLMNLVQNSICAVSEDSIAKKDAKIGISTRLKDDKFILTFADNGCGMSEEVQSRIFEPYYTTKAKGTGLGMTMVYKIIRELSGDISVKSVENQGTCFIISLPVPQTELRLLDYQSSDSICSVQS